MTKDLMDALRRRLEAAREVRALRVCKHEDCPYTTPEGEDECENHEDWMT